MEKSKEEFWNPQNIIVTVPMAAGAAVAVVGWWTGYKLGGVIALFTAEFFENVGIEDYWQTTLLVLGGIVVSAVDITNSASFAAGALIGIIGIFL